MGLVISALIIGLWTFGLEACAAVGGDVGSALAVALGVTCAGAIGLVLFASRPRKPLGPLRLALAVVGFAAGFSLGHALVPWLMALGEVELSAASALTPLALVPLEVVAPLLVGLATAHLTTRAVPDDDGANGPLGDARSGS